MFLVAVFVAGLLQATFLRDVNLLVVLVVFAGLRKGIVPGLAIGAAIGVFSGILSGASLGLNIALYAMTGLLSGIASSNIFYKEDVFTDIVFSFCGVVLFYAAYFMVTNSNHVPILTSALFSAALAPLLFRIVER